MFTSSASGRIGRYELKGLIGAGGMGRLYLARDTNPNTNRLVVVKLLNATLDSADLRQRFAREARALAALTHPNIVVVHDSGEHQGSPFIVMEYVRGETLAEKIKRQAPMSLAQKLTLMVELCSGLAHAHEAGIVHRDIKPANLIVDQHGRLKILDFGIARVSEGDHTRAGLPMTQLNVRIGTPGYMSPEQIEGEEIDARSDLFAVGSVCYELLSYRVAFSGSNTRQIEHQVLHAHPASLTSLIEGLDPEIERIIARALQKDPSQRYQDAATLEQALERQRWRLGRSDTAPPLARPTPVPSESGGRKSHDSRADAAYHRALAVYEDGAHEAARRFAIEALAEDSAHAGAQALLDRLEPQPPTPPPARSLPPTPAPPTELVTATPFAGQVTPLPPTVLSTTHQPARRFRQDRSGAVWKGHGRLLQVVVVLVAVGGTAGVVVPLGRWAWASRQPLTILRPAGGTISSRGITCGTGGSSCSAMIADGRSVQLRAEPDEGFLFQEFTGNCTPNGRTTMTAPRTCGATFVPIPVTPAAPTVALTVVPSEGGTILGTGVQCGTLGTECSTSHPVGAAIMLKALADPEYTLKGFTGDCSARGTTTMTEPRECGALFVRARRAAKAAPVEPPPPPVRPTRAKAEKPPVTPDVRDTPAASDSTPESSAPDSPVRNRSEGEPNDETATPLEPAPVVPSPKELAASHAKRALALHRSGAWQAALTVLRQAKELDRDNAGGRMLLAQMLNSAGNRARRARADAVKRGVNQQSPAFVDAAGTVRRAARLAEARQLEEAIRGYHHAASLFAKPPAARQPAPATAEEEIEEVLTRLEAAFRRHDAEGVRSIWPGQNFQSTFDECGDAYRHTFSNVSIRVVDSSTAIVQAVRSIECPRRGSNATANAEITLSKDQGTWQITKVLLTGR